MENITVGKLVGGCSTNGHMAVGKEGGGGGGDLSGRGKGVGRERRRGGRGERWAWEACLVWARGLSHRPEKFLKLDPLTFNILILVLYNPKKKKLSHPNYRKFN